jgi:glycosyltransferase involved in cell wall biosynthesis
MLNDLLEKESVPGLIRLERFISTTRRRNRRRRARRHCLPMISVIIPAHNERGYLGPTLDALRRQGYHKYEVLVAANGCTDGTELEARDRCSRLIVIPEKSLGRARNAGAEAAQGELLVFLDADTILEPRALSVIAKNFMRKHASGTLKGVPDTDRFGYHVLYFFKNLIHRCALHPGSVGVIICWKHAFDAVGGFDEALAVRENSDLMRRLEPWGTYRFIGDTAAVTSMRRYERVGAWRTAWLWIKLWVESWFVSLRNKTYETIR